MFETPRPLAYALTALHGVALAVGLFGILVAVPHPELWSHDPAAARIFTFALGRTGGLSLAIGALAMLAYGVWAVGARATLVFFAVACVVSASAELLGTATGWPFGGYAYTDFLGTKILGRVPYSVPLSWFFMGFAAYVLAAAFLRRRGVRGVAWPILLGAALLTAWDLVLDPAMASPALTAIRFWSWHEQGPYFGMPLRNLAGWFATGLVFIALARALGARIPGPGLPLAVPAAVYALNVGFAAILSAAAGLWPCALVGLVLCCLPVLLAR